MNKPKTIRELINVLIMGCGDIDTPVCVKISRRDEHGVVTHISLQKVSYVDSHDNICIEESDIKWQKYY
jgi:hypothetical protein